MIDIRKQSDTYYRVVWKSRNNSTFSNEIGQIRKTNLSPGFVFCPENTFLIHSYSEVDLFKIVNFLNIQNESD